MHLHFERIEKPHSFSDCNISTLSWMGKVPDGLLQNQDEEGWKLNRTNYYQDGWLASGNAKGIVGVTYTMCRCHKVDSAEMPSRTNYNLRGHRSEVTLVKWNEPYQKLASCDSSGIIFVWIKYEGRWSVELINDRNIQVTDFAWSHDGRMALICYVDGYVLIGSVAGQRYWSSQLNLDSCTTTCGIWTPDDQQVIFGTSNGSLLVIDINGTLVTQLSIRDGHSILSMAWSSEKFKMEDTEDDTSVPASSANRTYVLGICFDDGVLYLLKSYDDIFPIIIRTNLNSIKMEWSNKGELIAVAGSQMISSCSFTSPTPTSSSNSSYLNEIQFYNESGCLRYKISLDYCFHPITSLTWGHNDKRLFVATGPVLHTAWVTKRIASLQLLCRLMIQKHLNNESDVHKLPVPNCIHNLVSNLFGRTIRCYLPDGRNLTKFIANPPNGNARLYCTLIRHDSDNVAGESSSSSYVLYLEYLGGLVPILKGKRTSKFRPEFVIFDPEIKQENQQNPPDSQSSSSSKKRDANSSQSMSTYYWHSSSAPGTSDSESEEGQNHSLLHKTRRRRRQHRSRRNRDQDNADVNELLRTNFSYNHNFKPESTYQDEMPESERMVLVTSNIWGTKFKILGLVSWLPTYLGSIAYRTSLLHLQPRQMTLRIKELGVPRRSNNFGEFIPNDRGALFTSSEDEEECNEGSTSQYDNSYNIPIAPMTPKKTFQYQVNTGRNHRSSSPDHLSLHCVPCEKSNNESAYNFPCSSPSKYPISDGQEYINMISHLNDDLLTLQLNPGCSKGNFVSLEMTSANSDKMYGNPEAKFLKTKATASTSISTQTSFQSLSDFVGQDSSPLENLSKEKKGFDNHDFKFDTTASTRSDVFNELAQKYTSDISSFKSFSNQPFTQHPDLSSASNSLDSGIANSESSSQNVSQICRSSPPKISKVHRCAREKPTDLLKFPIESSEKIINIPKYSISSGSSAKCIKCPNLIYRCSPCDLAPQQSTLPSTSLVYQYSSPTYSNLSFFNNNAESHGVSPLSASSTLTMLSAYTTTSIPQGEKFICSPTKLTNSDIKLVDDQEIDENFDVTYSVARSPSFLFYRNRSSIAQCHHNYPASNNSCINNSHSYASEFANILSNLESNSLVNQTWQKRYTLFNGRKDHQVVNAAEHNLIFENTHAGKKNKDRPHNCMSLDDDESDIEAALSLSKLCKCHETDDNWIEIDKNRRNVKITESNEKDLSSTSILNNAFDDYGCDPKQSLLSSPVYKTRRKLLSFDSKEILNTLNEGNYLLKENSYSYQKAKNRSSHSEISRSSTKTFVEDRIPRRGSLTQVLISGDIKSFTSEMVNRSLPASPLTERRSKRQAQGKSIFYSPTMFRKVMKQK